MIARHRLRIRVTDEPDDEALVSARSVTLRQRLLAKLFGHSQRVTVLVPGRQVSSVEIVEPDDDLMAVADAVDVSRGGDRP